MSFSVTNNQIIHGDSLEKLKQLEDESIDCIVTDPPYGYSFMNKDWDKAVVSVDVWKECLRVMKHGAFAFIMSSPRQDVLCKMILNLIDAGFETNFTSIYWTYASGFPKAANVSKLVDKRNGTNLSEFAKLIKERRIELGLTKTQLAEYFKTSDERINHGGCVSNWEDGQNCPTLEQYNKLVEILKLDKEKYPKQKEAEREVIGTKKHGDPTAWYANSKRDPDKIGLVTKSATEAAKRLDGSYAGFQPKPALEVILTVMKPLSEKSFVDQALSNGKGITWLDDCRIPFKDEKDVYYGHHNKSGPDTLFNNTSIDNNVYGDGWKRQPNIENEKGRFPANLIVSDDALNDGKKHDRSKVAYSNKVPDIRGNNYNNYNKKLEVKPYLSDYGDSGSYSRYFDLDAWFLAIPKASTSERNKGLENEEPKQVRPEDGSWKSLDIFSNRYNGDNSKRGKVPLHQNNHPTVKPLKLMSYLITMGSRENDIILDPFCGSGTTCIAAYQLHRKFIGIEINKEYVDIANKRLEPYLKQTKLLG